MVPSRLSEPSTEARRSATWIGVAPGSPSIPGGLETMAFDQRLPPLEGTRFRTHASSSANRKIAPASHRLEPRPSSVRTWHSSAVPSAPSAILVSQASSSGLETHLGGVDVGALTKGVEDDRQRLGHRLLGVAGTVAPGEPGHALTVGEREGRDGGGLSRRQSECQPSDTPCK